MKSLPTIRITKLATTGLLLAAVLVSLPAFSRTSAEKKQLAREQFERAEQTRVQLISTPASQRSKQDYQRVTEAFRRVYYLSPTYSRADEAVVDVGDLLAETGRVYKDSKTLQAAIGQYEFLRREYPGSKFRVDALFAIGMIYRDDLNEPSKARATLQDFIHRYPHTKRIDDARQALADIDQPRRAARRQAFTSVRDAVLGPTAPARQATTDYSRPKQSVQPQAPSVETPATNSITSQDQPVQPVAQVTPDDKSQKSERRSTLPLVTGIRFWSTPDYTRVAIDLESEVKYEAGRVANPDRIFFDLHDTKLASALVGKSFDVEDGFLRKIRVAQYQRGLTRVVLDVADISDYSAFLLPNPYRLIIDIHGKKTGRSLASNTQQSLRQKTDETKSNSSASTPASAPTKNDTTTAKSTLSARTETGKTEVQPSSTGKAGSITAKETKGATEETGTVAKLGQPELKATSQPTSSPTFESVSPRDEVLPKASRRKRQAEAELAREARPTATGERSLTRALGLKIGRIVIDAGHGGHDTGTIGPGGLQEKDLVLDVALRLGKLLESRMGADVVYTRSDDTFIPLETRTAIANQHQADLFISIHANSSPDPSARGIETYYLRTTSSPDALEVAARENAVSQKSIHELQDLVRKITLNDKIDESREFAAEVQRSLYSGVSSKNPAVRNRGVKKAPFIVLIGANMPSILAEISFISNPTDEKKLFTPEYRQNIAEYLYRGINRYVDGLSGLKVASRANSPVSSKSAKGDSER